MFLKKLDDDERGKIEAGETVVVDSEYYGSLPIRKEFFVRSKELDFDLNKSIDVECPVR